MTAESAKGENQAGVKSDDLIPPSWVDAGSAEFIFSPAQGRPPLPLDATSGDTLPPADDGAQATQVPNQDPAVAPVAVTRHGDDLMNLDLNDDGNDGAPQFVPATLDRPQVSVRGVTLQLVPGGGDDASRRLQQLASRVADHVKELFGARGASVLASPGDQRVQLRLAVMDGDDARRLYRFDCLILARALTSPDGPHLGAVPRIFGEVVRQRADGKLEEVPSDPLFGSLLTELLAGLADMQVLDATTRSALGEPADGSLLQMSSSYASRLWNLVDSGTPAPTLDARLDRLTQQLERTLATAFKSRGAIVTPHPQSYAVDLHYPMPHPAGGSRLFDFQLQLQIAGSAAPGDDSPPPVFPRLFAEVTRLGADRVLTMEESCDDFQRLINEVQTLLQAR